MTQEAFDGLLAWLDADRELAGRKYEAVRRRLIYIFTCRGCRDAEDLADETINRVALKVPEIASGYVGDPALYFYGVAQKVYLESLRRKPRLPTQPPAPPDIELLYQCLERCVGKLPPGQRELVLQYYSEDRRAKIDARKELARRLGIELNALRIRAHRIRAALRECVRNCVNSGRHEIGKANDA
ncbi:MAG: RNA polymerase sigma factor [Pyrinomonadaceae bacterium]